MTSSSSVDAPKEDGVTISFGEKYAESQQFNALFQEGMTLVEETAAYLDGEGRDDAKTLEHPASLAYATESMRLTTRLMQVASWLLVQRAVREGEMMPEEAAQSRYRLGAHEICRGPGMEASDLLPERLLDLMKLSENLYERIDRLDESLYRAPTIKKSNVVSTQLSMLESAFSVPAE